MRRTRIIVERNYRDTATGEAFAAWRVVRGWRLAVLRGACELLTASASAVLGAAGRVLMVVGALGLVACLMSCGGRAVTTVEPQKGAEARCVLDFALCAKEKEVRERVKTLEAKAAATPKEVHLCGAPTKEGGACKRHVRREGLHCWMHGGPSEAELNAGEKK